MSGKETMSTATLALRLLPPDTLGGSLKGWGRLFCLGTVGHSVLPEEEESPRGRLGLGDVWAGKSPAEAPRAVQRKRSRRCEGVQEGRLCPELSREHPAPNTWVFGCKYPGRAAVNSN